MLEHAARYFWSPPPEANFDAARYQLLRGGVAGGKMGGMEGFSDREDAARLRAHLDELFDELHAELRRLASSIRAKKQPQSTEWTTHFVHGAWEKLGQQRKGWTSREHFMAEASRAIERVVLDAAKRDRAAKRGFGRGSDTDVETLPANGPSNDLIDLEPALNSLRTENERVADVFGMTFFGGMTTSEIAAQLGISIRTVQVDLKFARQRLRQKMDQERRRGTRAAEGM